MNSCLGITLTCDRDNAYSLRPKYPNHCAQRQWPGPPKIDRRSHFWRERPVGLIWQNQRRTSANLSIFDRKLLDRAAIAGRSAVVEYLGKGENAGVVVRQLFSRKIWPAR